MVERRLCVLGIDLGTSAVKVVAVSQEGQVVASARESYRTITTSEGQAEQDCELWLKALTRAAKKVRTRLAQKFRVHAIALTGQMPTLVVLKRDRPIANAITWQDSRADRWASERIDLSLRRQVYKKTGVIIDGRYLVPMFKFHHASDRTKADLILSAKDFLFHALTGEAATDPSTASGSGVYNLESRAWDADLCKFWDVSIDQLAPIKSSTFSAPLGKLGGRTLGSAPGTPVVLGCADSVAGFHALNTGELSTHTATILTGSSSVILKADSKPRWDDRCRYLVTPLAVDGRYGREADLLAAGSVREWAEKVFPKDTKTRQSVWQAAYSVTPGANGLLFAPYLAGGEQGVLWNPNLRGTLTGLTLAHRGAHIARALLEGMGFEIRRCLELFDDEHSSLVRVTGWITNSSEEVQLLADVLGRTVQAHKLQSASAVGAALLTGLVDNQRCSGSTEPVVFPASEKSRRYGEVYARYLKQFPAGACGAT